jgi:hypothetical protein
MKFSRRILLSYFGSFVSIPYLLGSCKTTNQAQTAAENTDEVKEEIAENSAQSFTAGGFKIVSPEGAKGLCQYNNAGKITTKYMQIVGTDGQLTISDLSWDTYKINGQVKRWKFDENDWTTAPLTNFTFSKAYSKKDISIEVAFFPPSNMFYPTRIYQQLIRLG